MPNRSNTLFAQALALVLALSALCAAEAQAACPPAERDAASLQQLRGAKFEGLDSASRANSRA